ncbi:MAG: hypothetical protein ONB44_08410 [candidate division KSB1 bacterium]|nr:hypothetical protein [candidate division KSB1 bacterium]MDZ7302151.1 hypothetical protein [candidate division KSB1 bacterium]MDZ7311261.1 hypothetical protein [candidate division KSB1 bacterium]
MNRDHRKTLALIFADVAKYSFTAGVLAPIISGEISLALYLLVLFAPMLVIGIIFAVIFALQDRKQAQRR